MGGRMKMVRQGEMVAVLLALAAVGHAIPLPGSSIVHDSRRDAVDRLGEESLISVAASTNSEQAADINTPKQASKLKLAINNAMHIKTPMHGSVHTVTPMADAMLPGTEGSVEPEKYVDLVIAIPSMRQWQKNGEPAPEQYLEPLARKLWAESSQKVRERIHFVIMNVDPEPNKHTELMRVANTLPKVRIITKGKPFDVTDMMEKLDDGKIMLNKKDHTEQVTTTTMNWIAGETKDVPTLLTVASREAPYVLFLEDDVKPTKNAIAKIMSYIAKSDDNHLDNWFMVDLYTPNINWKPVPATNMQLYAFECCTQAMLFRSSKVEALIAYENEHPELPVDDNIRDFSAAEPAQFGIYSMVPNPFEHVGRYSSNPEKSYGIE